MPCNINFTINLNDEPYVDSFTQGKTCQAKYVGLRYVKVEYDTTSGLIKHIVAQGDNLKDVDQVKVIPEPNHDHFIIDANIYPWEASYLTSDYEYAQVPTYEENLGTLDDEGNPEIWKYTYSVDGSVLTHIFVPNDLKFINGEFVKPRVRLHMVTRENYIKMISTHIAMCDEELSRTVYRPEELEIIRNYKSFVQQVLNKYGDTKHWKIQFPVLPKFKP